MSGRERAIWTRFSESEFAKLEDWRRAQPTTEGCEMNPGQRVKRRKTSIGGAFAPRLIEMLVSPAFCALSLSARRVLDRIEVEFASHGGTENGKLPVTFDDFHRFHIHRYSSAPAIREAVALGFVEITKAGRAGNAEYRTPNEFRLTYRQTDYADPTHEWRRIHTYEQALEIADAARKDVDIRYNSRRTKNRNPVPETTNVTVPVNAPVTVPETITTPIVQKPSRLTISPSGHVSAGSSGNGKAFW
jgi:hypothetical protein